jgi:hypothetical protein
MKAISKKLMEKPANPRSFPTGPHYLPEHLQSLHDPQYASVFTKLNPNPAAICSSKKHTEPILALVKSHMLRHMHITLLKGDTVVNRDKDAITCGGGERDFGR